MTTREDEMVARLRRKLPGYVGTLGEDGRAIYADGEQMVLANPDGPEAADALTALSSERDLLREALERAREFLTSAPMESGYCCCGDPVEGHNIGSGHSPVDALAYAVEGVVKRIDAALTGVTGG